MISLLVIDNDIVTSNGDRMPNNLKALRNEKGFTQEQLGDHIGVSKQAVWKWENGERPITIEVAERLAEKLECRVQDIDPTLEPRPDIKRELLRKVMDAGFSYLEENKYLLSAQETSVFVISLYDNVNNSEDHVTTEQINAIVRTIIEMRAHQLS